MLVQKHAKEDQEVLDFKLLMLTLMLIGSIFNYNSESII